MKYITEITRRDITDIIRDGIGKGLERIYVPYYGRLSELEFLQRLYPLQTMPSTDRRYRNAYGDIYQHTVNNDDWDNGWVLYDSRFELTHGSEDEPLLKFICEMFNPYVRKETAPWKDYLTKFNELLAPDGYELYEKRHVSGRTVYDFRRMDFIEIDSTEEHIFAELKCIGSGSYATVSKYYDKRYDKWFAVKKAKRDLNDKELVRFRNEFDYMKTLNSLYVVEVYTYDESKNQYVMELMSESIEQYINYNNSVLTNSTRVNLIMQILRALEYIHSKGYLHRDICPKNILIKKYDDAVIVKLSDFGLVKKSESDLTSVNTDIKGYYNDPELQIVGFNHYDILHEIYALTRLIVFILTGKNNYENIKDTKIFNFLQKGTNPERNRRFQTIDEVRKAVLELI